MTTLQRLAPDVIEALAEHVWVLNDRALDGSHGGGDVDCAVWRIHPFWHLRLRDWRLCQELRYDTTARYYVLVRGDETLAVDVLEDPDGIGRYGFRTKWLSTDGESGALAAAPERAVYLTVKRIVKRRADTDAWSEISMLGSADPARYRARLSEALGDTLAEEVAEMILGGTAPSQPVLDDWRARHRRRRFLEPEGVLARTRLSAERIAGRMLHPTGLVVAIVGPDGAGKSSVCGALPDACGQLFRRSRRIHFRPGLLPRPGAVFGREASDASQPHARAPHGRVLSTLILGYHWLDVLLGHAFLVAPARRRTTLVVVERGFADIAVDPVRYRLDAPPWLVRGLARMLPRPDLTIRLDASPDAIETRKAELPAREIERQNRAWASLIPRSRAVTIDADRALLDVIGEVRRAIVRTLEERTATRVSGGWVALPRHGGGGLHVPRTNSAAALGTLELEAPSKRHSRLGVTFVRTAASLGALRALPAVAPPLDVRRAIAHAIPPGGTCGVRRAIHPGRYLVAVLDGAGQPVALGKVALNDLGHARLRAELRAIERFSPLLVSPLRAPKVDSVRDNVLVFEWIAQETRPRPWFLPSDVTHALGALFATGMTEAAGGPVGPAHGDFAPWNLLRSGDGWYLVDWEVALDEAPAFFDVFHFLVQGHSFLGRPRRDELLGGLDGRGWVGDAIAAYAVGAGLPSGLSRPSFKRYLEHTSTPETMRDMSVEATLLRGRLISELDW